MSDRSAHDGSSKGPEPKKDAGDLAGTGSYGFVKKKRRQSSNAHRTLDLPLPPGALDDPGEFDPFALDAAPVRGSAFGEFDPLAPGAVPEESAAFGEFDPLAPEAAPVGAVDPGEFDPSEAFPGASSRGDALAPGSVPKGGEIVDAIGDGLGPGSRIVELDPCGDDDIPTVAREDLGGVDLARFAAEMDQLAAELDSVVNRPLVVSPGKPPESPPEANPLATDPLILRASTSGASSFTSSSWDPFEDDLFEDANASPSPASKEKGADPLLVEGEEMPASGGGHAVMTVDEGDAPSLMTVDEGDAPSLMTVDEGDASSLMTGDASSLMTGSHQALDLGGGDAQDEALDLDDSIELRPPHDSGTLWQGPSIAEPQRTGEVQSPYSNEYSAEYSSPYEESPERLSALREFFRTLDTTVRVLNLYEGKGKSSERALKTAHHELEELLDRYSRIVLRVTPYEFIYGSEAIYTSEEDRHGLTFRLFRDGVRELSFVSGVSIDELRGLLDILRLTQRSTEDDSVTLLWQKNLRHIEYRAVDTFLEGIVDTGGGRKDGAVDELVAIASAPLHRDDRIEKIAIRALKPLPHELVVMLGRSLPEVDPAELGGRLENLDADLWQRAIWLCLHLIDEGGSDAGVVDLLVKVFQEILQAGRWETLAAVSRAVQEAMGADSSSSSRASLEVALAQISVGDRLLDLVDLLETAKPKDYPAIIAFFRLLPKTADPSLQTLLGRLSVNALQDRLASLLIERGVDLVAYHQSRLGSSDPKVVLGAIRSLAKIPGDVALKALLSQLEASNWRITLAAVLALEDRIEEPSKGLVACLLGESHQVRDKVLDLLERLPVTEGAGEELYAIVFDKEHDRWTDKQLARATSVLVRWGGASIDARLIQGLTQGNPFRRRRIEDRRQQIFEAIQRVGGQRALDLLVPCLERKLADPVRHGMRAVVAKIERELATGDDKRTSSAVSAQESSESRDE